MENKLIKEVNSIRAIACLCVVLLHAIQVRLFTWDSNDVLRTVLVLLAFGTPTFVFLSELILSRSYPNRLPNRFFRKRVIPILVPFIFISFLYAFVQDMNDIPHLLRDFAYNLLGNYHGPWFVLVIFQFYALHRIFVKFLSRVRATIVLTGSLLINLAYLAVFNLIAPPSETGFTAYLWEFGYWVPCIGWLFYFSLAYYCGKNYERFIRSLKKRQYLVLTAPLFGLALILYDNSFHVMPYGSKRMDMVIFTTTMILALFLILSQLNKQPVILEFISKYTFGIFLIHLFFMRAAKKMIDILGFNLGYFEIPLLFLSALSASIIAAHVLNRFPQGKYLIGGIKQVKMSEPVQSSDTRSPAM